jgi:hypothetical protein
VDAQTKPRQQSSAHIQKVEDLKKLSIVQNAIKALNIKVQNIADLEPLTCKPTKIV